MADFSPQSLAIAAGIMGGVFSVTNAALRLAEKTIASKRNGGSAHGDAKMIHEDVKLVHSDLKECTTKMDNLTRAADGFRRSHEVLKELAQEQVAFNRAFHTQFSIFLERFGTHCVNMEDKKE